MERPLVFVPTMGALHEGHLSLVRKAKRDTDIVVVSIFVNPLQFSPNEDFDNYPRLLSKDKVLARQSGVDILFVPYTDKMCTEELLSFVSVPHLEKKLCGLSRKGHFTGVTTIITKLLNIVLPNVLYLGQKDIQQVLVIKKMIRDLNNDVQVKVCPIVRDSYGLAMSSRNSGLSLVYRREATVLYSSLKEARRKIINGEKRNKKIVDFIRKNISNHSRGEIDYVVCVDSNSLEDLIVLDGKVLIAVAVKFDSIRLIDNIMVNAV